MKSVKINGEFEIILPEHRANRPEWFTEDGWEKKRIQSMHQHLTKQDSLFYIGAEEGDIAALCSMWVHDIVMFEPNDKVWTNMKAIWKANNLPDPWWFSGFASNQTTVKPVLRYGFDDVEGDVISDHGFMELENHNAPEVKIDDLPIRPTAITLDVEGSEWEVLKGAEQTLINYHPKIWLSLHPEFLFRIYGSYQADLRNWIKDRGYKETLLDYQHECHLMYLPK